MAVPQTIEELDAMLKDIEIQSKWAAAEIRRLLAENMELKLKIENLNYYIRTATLDAMLTDVDIRSKWADLVGKRILAENVELKLKIENLTYYIHTLTQGTARRLIG